MNRVQIWCTQARTRITFYRRYTKSGFSIQIKRWDKAFHLATAALCQHWSSTHSLSCSWFKVKAITFKYNMYEKPLCQNHGITQLGMSGIFTTTSANLLQRNIQMRQYFTTCVLEVCTNRKSHILAVWSSPPVNIHFPSSWKPTAVTFFWTPS